MALFKSYAVIYLSIDAAICDALQVSHTLLIFYCTARANFDRLSITIARAQCLQLPGFVRVFPEIWFGKRTTDIDRMITEIDHYKGEATELE